MAGSYGGTNWPGGCYDPETHKVFVFSETTAEVGSMVPGDPKVTEFEYINGAPGVVQRRGVAMGAAGSVVGSAAAERVGPVGADGFRPGQVTVDNLPLMKPPYGTISAIDLKDGSMTWQIAHGETPDAVKNHPALKGLKIPRTGRPGLLGPMVTKTLVICGEAGFATTPSGARGAMLRAYDKVSGEERGAVYMAAPQTGSPMTYLYGGRQYIAVAIGGGSHSAELIVFRLPRS